MVKIEKKIVFYLGISIFFTVCDLSKGEPCKWDKFSRREDTSIDLHLFDVWVVDIARVDGAFWYHIRKTYLT